VLADVTVDEFTVFYSSQVRTHLGSNPLLLHVFLLLKCDVLGVGLAPQAEQAGDLE
jgi:hypothetical protein